MNTIQISNEGTVAEISLQNSQLFSLKRNGLEVMWGGGAPAYLKPKSGWQNSEIVMFPIVGSAIDNKILIAGDYYPMGKHGITRDLPWNLLEASDDKIVMRQLYHANDRVKSQKNGAESVFPSSYRLTKTYSIDDDGILHFEIEVKNRSDFSMPYAVGWHPAFMTPEGSVIKAQCREIPEAQASIPLEMIRKAEGCVIELGGADIIRYITPQFVLTLEHNFGMTQLWDKGEGYCAVEAMSAPSMSRMGLNEITELARLKSYRRLEKNESKIFAAEILLDAPALA